MPFSGYFIYIVRKREKQIELLELKNKILENEMAIQ